MRRSGFRPRVSHPEKDTMNSNMHRIRQRTSLAGVLCRGLDTAAVFAGFLIAGLLASDGATPLAAAVATVLFYFAAEIASLYRNWQGVSLAREVGCAFGCWTLALGLSVGVAFALPWFGEAAPRISLAALASWFAATAGLFAAVRVGLRAAQRYLRAKGFHVRGFAILGVNELGFQLARNIENTPHLGLKLVGFFDDRPANRIPNVPVEVGRHVGTIGELVEQARGGEIDRIYITLPMRTEDRIRRLLAELSDSTASVHIVPDFFVFELLHSCWTDIGGLPVVSVFEHPFYGVDGLVKRVTDLVLASLLLVALAGPLLVIALAVKLTSPGPVFFRQKRYGMDGKEIRVWKFRSMRVCDDGPVVAQASKNDPRLTPIGGFLRRMSLDELPQLFNVLGGSMSLVGPRPHASAHNEDYRRRIRGYMLRHKVKPGITGLAQVSGWRGETDTLYKMEKRIECDHRYIREWSWWNDLKILAHTVTTVLRHENAYSRVRRGRCGSTQPAPGGATLFAQRAFLRGRRFGGLRFEQVAAALLALVRFTAARGFVTRGLGGSSATGGWNLFRTGGVLCELVGFVEFAVGDELRVAIENQDFTRFENLIAHHAFEFPPAAHIEHERVGIELDLVLFVLFRGRIV